VEHVSSRQNSIVKRFREAGRQGLPGDAVLLDGPHLVAEAIDSGVTLEVVAFTADVAKERLAPLAGRCQASGARVVTVPESLLAVMTPVRQASGVVAIARLRAAMFTDVLEPAPQLIAVLDRVQDPGNVGAIVRVAEGCGATAVITGPGTADPFGWKALRGSMGSAFRLPIARVDSLSTAIHGLRAAGVRIFAAVPRGGTPVRQAHLAGPAAIVLGGEGSGLAGEMIGQADELLTIDMRPPVESLNVSVAAALALYEASRQRADVAVR
jgi:TrmH family RNA methyltransferase